jgi:peptidoglycan/xylan/chitin deacetylase (PgdA/CDA1 family)
MLDVRDNDGAQAVTDRIGLGNVPMILMYHGVADVAEDPYQLFVTPSRFAEQMTWLKRRGLRGVGIGTLIDAMRAGRGSGLVGITFDDGYVNVLDNAVPELLRHDFTATMFIISGRLGGTNEWDEGPVWPLMSAGQVAEVAAAGMEIGSHSATHVRLSKVDGDRLEAEVSGSRASLGELMGAPIRGFAYPWGSNDAAARRAVRDAGYDYACAVETPVTELGLMALPRICFSQGDGTGRMATKQILFRPYTAISGTRRQIARSPSAQAVRLRVSGRPGFRS